MKQGNIIFITLLLTILLGVVEPLRALFTAHELSENYVINVGLCVVLLVVLALYILYMVRSRRKAQENVSSLSQQDLSPLSGQDYYYQEPMQQFDQHPVRIVNHAGHHAAVFDVRYKNAWEKWMTVLGLFDYSNIELTTNDTVVYYEQLPLQKALKRPKWNVFVNQQHRGLLEMAPLSKAGLKKQAVFYYDVRDHRYIIQSPRINPHTFIQNDQEQTLMQGERTMLDVGNKGNDGARGKKHHVITTDTGDLSTAEKLGLYQQIMMKMKQS